MCISIVLACLTTCCTAVTCKLCGTVGGKISQATRLTYSLLLGLSTAAAVAMLSDWAQGALEHVTGAWLEGYPDMLRRNLDPAAILNLQGLAGAMAVHRVMLGAAAFHMLLAALTASTGRWAKVASKIQNELWAVKLLGYVALVVGAFLLPTALVEPFIPVFKIGAAIFIMWQVRPECVVRT
jgi:hypothetical protein